MHLQSFNRVVREKLENMTLKFMWTSKKPEGSKTIVRRQIMRVAMINLVKPSYKVFRSVWCWLRELTSKLLEETDLDMHGTLVHDRGNHSENDDLLKLVLV